MKLLLENGDTFDLSEYGIAHMPNNTTKVTLRFQKDFDNSKLIGKGFRLYDDTGTELDFTDCIHQYNINNPLKYGIIMTNTENYHDAPQKPLTETQRIQLLNDVKEEKLTELSEQCQKLISNGVSLKINGVLEHFSYTLTDQNNIDDLFRLAAALNLPQPYHCNGDSCRLYSVEEIKQIYTAQKSNKAHHTTYFNQLKAWLLTLDTEEEVENIEYGMKLPDEYLAIYNDIMNQSLKIIQSLTEK